MIHRRCTKWGKISRTATWNLVQFIYLKIRVCWTGSESEQWVGSYCFQVLHDEDCFRVFERDAIVTTGRWNITQLLCTRQEIQQTLSIGGKSNKTSTFIVIYNNSRPTTEIDDSWRDSMPWQLLYQRFIHKSIDQSRIRLENLFSTENTLNFDIK